MGAISTLSHAALSAVYAYTTYVYVYGIKPPKEIVIIRYSNYGPFKYLTFWDLLLQLLFFTLCSVADFTSSENKKKKKPALQSLLDFLFSTVVFSTAAFVAASFWAIFIIDRELIFPAIYDTFFPNWLNHAVHTLPLVAVSTELMCVRHSFPTQRKGFLTVASFALLYLIWVLFIASSTGHWVYPILAKLTAVGRAGFIALMCVLIGIFYILGYGLQALRWGHESSDEQLVYHKKK